MNQLLQKYLEPVITMNRRILVGGGVLGLVLATESILTMMRPLV